LVFGCLLALLKFELSCPEAIAMAAACRGEAAREEKNESCWFLEDFEKGFSAAGKLEGCCAKEMRQKGVLEDWVVGNFGTKRIVLWVGFLSFSLWEEEVCLFLHLFFMC
jgi:hypothetical protein